MTIKIIPDIEAAWLQWQRQEHIPAIMALGLFSEWKMFRLLNQDDTEGSTYVIQLFAPSMKQYDHFMKEYATALQQQTFDKWGDRYIAFRTVMQVVH